MPLLPVMDAIGASVIDQIDRLNSWDDAERCAAVGPLQAMFGSGGTLDGAGTVIGRLPAALQSATDGTEEFAAASGMAKDEIDGLSNALTGYLDGGVRSSGGAAQPARQLPEPVRGAAHRGLARTMWLASLEDIATGPLTWGGVGELRGVGGLTITRLRQMRDAGQISADQFNRVRDAIRGAQDEAPLTQVADVAPGGDGCDPGDQGCRRGRGKVPPMTYAGVQARAQLRPSLMWTG